MLRCCSFIPGTDLYNEDGTEKCDIETAHYYLQVFDSGEAYTIQRTAISFLELDRDLARRFPKLSLPCLPLYEIQGAAAIRKTLGKKGHKKCEASLDVDGLLAAQGGISRYMSALLAIEPVLGCQELRSFLASSEADCEADNYEPVSMRSVSFFEQKEQLVTERFGSDDRVILERVLTEALPVERHKLQPSHIFEVTLEVEEAGQYLAWCFTTLPGKSSPAKDVAFSVSFNGIPVRPYERCDLAPVEVIHGSWACPTPGTAALVFHNDYSKWYAKHLAYKATVVTASHFSQAQRRIRRGQEDKRPSRVIESSAVESAPEVKDDGLRDCVSVDPAASSDSASGADSASASGAGAVGESLEAMKDEVARLRVDLQDMTAENSALRHQMDDLAAAKEALEKARDEDAAARLAVQQASQMVELESELAREKEAHREARDR